MAHRAIAVGFAAAVVIASSTSATAAAAAAAVQMTAGPHAGQCYQTAVRQWMDAKWITDNPVSCNKPHNFEVVKVGRIKNGALTRAALDLACSYELVARKTGIPSWQAAIIDYPSRVATYRYRIGTDGYVCGGSAEERYPHNRIGLETVNRPFRLLSGTESSRLSQCYSDDGTGGAPAFPHVSAPCDSALHWVVTRWVDLRVFYTDYPGDSVLDERGRAWCADADRFAYPSAENWMKDGRYVVECQKRIPPATGQA
jgi:hypothetical protein